MSRPDESDNLPDMRPVENAPGFAVPVYRYPLAIGQRKAMPASQPDASLLSIVDTIEACAMKRIKDRIGHPPFMIFNDTMAAIEVAVAQGVADGVTAVQDRLTGEVERLRAAMLRAADTLAPIGAPSCFAPKDELVRAMAKVLREEAGK